MIEENEDSFAGTCGFYCGSCSINLAMKKDKSHQSKLAAELSKHFGRSVKIAEIQCNGCRNLSKDCWGYGCKIRTCAQNRNITYCYECKDFPCEDLSKFSELYNDVPLIQLSELKEKGVTPWLANVKKRFSCKNCATGPVEAGTMKCWSCGFNCKDNVIKSLDVQ